MGERFGRYELVRVLGSGGAGRVFEAVLHGPGGFRHAVALKVLHAGADELRREARLGGLLRHQNLVDAYEVGEVDGRWFCAMELCRGGTLAGRPAMPARAVVEVGLQVCDALSYAHGELGLVHLDLKPGNLLVHEGVVKVADLGIARAAGFAHDGRIRGTPGYMAPEQARGDDVDARADVYALGVTLAELASGRGPGAASTCDPDQSPAPPSDLGELPDGLAELLDRCTAPDPAGRFPDMDALASALRALEVDGPGLREVVGWTPAAAPGSAAAPPTDLGASPDAVVGRVAEGTWLADRLAAPCLVTVRGPAGVGKSRLAREAARAWHERTGRQAWLCDLAAATTEDDVLGAVARALDLRLGDDGAAVLGHALRGRGDVVLVLDNVEDVAVVAALVGRWRAVAPRVRFLVTARQAVRADGEELCELGPLSEAEAVALLAARALARGADVALDPALPELARRLDGLPLALELAAGRMGVLSPGEVLDRLGLDLLRSGDPSRHGTLRAALDASCALLGPDDLRAFTRLSVFVGSFSLDAAEAVMDGSALDRLALLLDRSLLATAGDRFRLLRPVRAYASERLADPLDAEIRHGEWFARAGAGAAVERLAALGVRSVEADADELNAAARRALGRGDARVALACGVALATIAQMRGPYLPVITLLRAIGDRWPAARILEKQAVLLGEVGRVDEAEALLARALEACRAEGDLRGEAVTLTNVGTLHRHQGRLELAARWTAEAAEVDRRIADRPERARIRLLLGAIATDARRSDEARAHYREALAGYRAKGDRRGEAVTLANLALELPGATPMDEVRAAYDAALAIHREVGNRPEVAVALVNLGVEYQTRGRPGEAVALTEEALAVIRELGNRRLEAVATGNLGVAHHGLHHLDEARAMYRAAIELHREVGTVSRTATLLTNLGNAEADAGDLPAARAAYARALAVAREVGNRVSEATTEICLARLDRRAGDLAAATARLERSRDAAKALRHERLVGQALSELGELSALAGDRDGARRLLEEAMLLARRVGDATLLATVLLRRALLDRAEGAGAAAEARSLLAGLPVDPDSDLGRLLADVEGDPAG